MCTPFRDESSGVVVKEASELSSQKSLLYHRPWIALGPSNDMTAPLALRCTFPHHCGMGHREAVLRQRKVSRFVRSESSSTAHSLGTWVIVRPVETASESTKAELSTGLDSRILPSALPGREMELDSRGPRLLPVSSSKESNNTKSQAAQVLNCVTTK